MRHIALFVLVIALLMLAAGGVSANGPQVPPGCEGGAWVVVYAGIEGHRWYDPFYGTFSPENHYGAGWKYDPCFPVGSTSNGYGIGYDGVSKP